MCQFKEIQVLNNCAISKSKFREKMYTLPWQSRQSKMADDEGWDVGDAEEDVVDCSSAISQPNTAGGRRSEDDFSQVSESVITEPKMDSEVLTDEVNFIDH